MEDTRPAQAEETGLEQPLSEGELSEAEKQLTADEMKVVKALLAGKTLRAAGASVGKTKRTVQNWIRKPPVRQVLREGREALRKEASTLLHAQTSWAVRTLRDLALDKELAGMARVVAARSVVELAYRGAAEDHGDQLAEIREELAAIRTEGAGEAEEADGAGVGR